MGPKCKCGIVMRWKEYSLYSGKIKYLGYGEGCKCLKEKLGKLRLEKAEKYCEWLQGVKKEKVVLEEISKIGVQIDEVKCLERLGSK